MPLASERFDGMALEPALTRVWGDLPCDLSLTHLRGDLSTRSYYRVASPEHRPRSLVVMRLSGPLAPGAELPFVNLQRHLARRGVRVPRIYAEDLAHGLVLLEDLGDETFERRLLATPEHAWLALYERAVRVLRDLHERMAAPDPACIAYGRGFDEALLRWELEHFREWGLSELGAPLDARDGATIDTAFSHICREVLALPAGMAHRDYQSRNLMWLDDELVVIDFQDALRGPAVYDLVALLCDSYVPIGAALQQTLIDRYAALAGEDPCATSRAFHLVTIQRKLKDAGRFVFADRVRGNASFLPFYGPSLRYVARALRALSDPVLAPLEALLARAVPGYPDAVPPPAPRTGVRRELQ